MEKFSKVTAQHLPILRERVIPAFQTGDSRHRERFKVLLAALEGSTDGSITREHFRGALYPGLKPSTIQSETNLLKSAIVKAAEASGLGRKLHLFTPQGRGAHQLIYLETTANLENPSVSDWGNNLYVKQGTLTVDDLIASVHDLSKITICPQGLDIICGEIDKLAPVESSGKGINRAVTYALIVEAWLGNIEKHRLLREEKKLLLQDLALHFYELDTHEENPKFFWDDLADWLRKWLKLELPLSTMSQDQKESYESLLNDLCDSTFLISLDQDCFFFVHKSIFEYFLALCLCRRLENGELKDDPAVWKNLNLSPGTQDFLRQLQQTERRTDEPKGLSADGVDVTKTPPSPDRGDMREQDQQRTHTQTMNPKELKKLRDQLLRALYEHHPHAATVWDFLPDLPLKFRPLKADFETIEAEMAILKSIGLIEHEKDIISSELKKWKVTEMGEEYLFKERLAEKQA